MTLIGTTDNNGNIATVFEATVEYAGPNGLANVTQQLYFIGPNFPASGFLPNRQYVAPFAYISYNNPGKLALSARPLSIGVPQVSGSNYTVQYQYFSQALNQTVVFSTQLPLSELQCPSPAPQGRRLLATSNQCSNAYNGLKDACDGLDFFQSVPGQIINLGISPYLKQIEALGRPGALLIANLFGGSDTAIAVAEIIEFVPAVFGFGAEAVALAAGGLGFACGLIGRYPTQYGQICDAFLDGCDGSGPARDGCSG